MTDAHIFNGTTIQNNEIQKNCTDINGLCASNKTTHTNSMENQKSNFSDSVKDKALGNLCLQAEKGTDCLINKPDCNAKNCSTVALNREKNLINKLQKNTMSKYDSKATEKLKGHYKNSLRRKRRSFTRNNENNIKKHVSGIYEVIEDQNKERRELNLPKFEPSELIKNSDILDFPLESLIKTKKPHHNTLQKGEPRHYHPKNNDQYFPKSEIREDTDGVSDENSSRDHQYRDDEYETLRKKRTQKGTQDLLDNLNSRYHLPKTTEVIEESAEVNIRKKPEHVGSSYRDEDDDRSDKSYTRGENVHEDINSSNNDSPRENIRSYADNLKISNDEQSENDSGELINKNYSSLNDDDEDEEDIKDGRFNENQKQNVPEDRKQEFRNDNINKNINKDPFSYEDEENDEESNRNLKNYKNLQVPSHNLRSQNDKFYNGKNLSPASKKSSNLRDEKNERSEDSEEDESEDDDSEDDDEPLGNFKKEENVHVNKSPVSDTLEQHHQKYNDEYFSLAPKIINKDNENYKKDEENDNDDPKENLNVDREHHEYSQPQINFQNKNYAQGSEKFVKENDDSNERRDSYKEKQSQENVKHDVSNHEYKKPNLISQKQSQFYNNDNNGYPLLEPKKLNEELNERQHHNKDNGFNVNKGTIKNFSRETDLPTVTEENTPLLNYRNADSEISQENDSRLKYASQPIDIKGTVGRPDIQIKASIENGIRHFLTSDRPIYANTEFGSNFHGNFTDNKQKETKIPNDNYNENPSLYRKQVQKSLENSKAVQEVDLSNFSYDKFRGLSDVDRFEPVTYKEEASTIKPKIKKKNRKSANIRKSNKNKPIHIHVPKPVKDIGNENIREENKRHYNEDLSDNYQGTISKGGKHHKSNSNKKLRKPKVKSLNYNQAAAKIDTSDKVTESEGTLDTLSPKTNEFDENLKAKFGNVNIKLPEIKLPKNILSYSSDDQVSKDKIKSNHNTYAPLEPKQKSLGNPENINHYDPTDAAKYSEQPNPKAGKPADDYDFFASYINKPHEGSHSDDAHSGDIEDGEDLYERFVRERFGRKDSFKERSEKLKEKKASENKPITKNKELFDNIQKAIKRAEEVQKEAQKSKDPKANYLWTLEYGEKL